jgi:predicted ATPase/class 3 adenylate cyclase
MGDFRPVALPSGLVTFVLTDIEGSTRIFRRIGDRYHELLELHHEILRSAWDEFGGAEFKTEGDAVLVAFEGAAEAIDASVHAQQTLWSQSWPADAEIRVRIGVHTGLASPRAGDYIAFALHQAARVVGVGHGGQIVISADSAQRVPDAERVTLRSLGRYRVRDFDEPLELFQPVAPGLPDTFPPLRALPADRHNLMAPLTSLVGRATELKELAELVAAHRFVTVVGTGGLGKTRLAIEYGLAHAEDWEGGVWMADLSGVADGAAVPQAIAAAVGAPVASESNIWTAVLGHLRGRELVLVLDNCEHLATEVALRVQALLRACPGVRVLATSRAPIGLQSERIWRPAALTETTATELFNERAGLTTHEDATSATVAALCRRLDGLPLAIELAAARADLVPPKEILAQLDRSIGVLRSRDPTVDPRQRSLDEVIGWSYELLAPAERAAFRRFGLFSASFDMASAAAAAMDEGVVADEVPELTWSLLAKSLLASEPTAGDTRYRMLETVRVYARRQLHEADDAVAVANSLGRFYIAAYGPQIESSGPGLASDRAINIENFRGLIPVVAARSVEIAQTLALIVVRIVRNSSPRGGMDEGIDFLRELSAATAVRAGLLVETVRAANEAGEFDVAAGLLDEADAIGTTVGIPEWLDRRIDQQRAVVAINRGDADRARVIGLAALEHAVTVNGTRLALDVLAMAAAERGAYEEATDATERALQICRDNGDLDACAVLLANLAEIAFRAGERTAAAARQLESLDIAVQTGHLRELTSAVMLGAKLAGESGDWIAASRLQAAADQAMSEAGFKLYVPDRVLCDALLATAKSHLSDNQFESAHRAGTALGMDEAVEETRRILERPQ